MNEQKPKRSLTDRLLKAGPAIGATLGGAYMLKKRGLKGGARGAMMSGLEGATAGAGIGWLPDIYAEGAKSMKTASISVTAAEAYWSELEKIAGWFSFLRPAAKETASETAENLAKQVKSAVTPEMKAQRRVAKSKLTAMKDKMRADRVSETLEQGKKLDEDPRVKALRERMNGTDKAASAKRGLWDNIHAKRRRIKAGSGEQMRRPGSKGAPTERALEKSAADKWVGSTAPDHPDDHPSVRLGKGVSRRLDKKNPDRPRYASLKDFILRRPDPRYKPGRPKEKKAEVEYRGTKFPGYNKPIASNRKGKKKMVLVKRGDKVKLVHFGQKGYEDYTQHKDKARRKNYLARSGGIKGKGGKLTKNDPFSPNYWARKELW